jgi:hypothetical protein
LRRPILGPMNRGEVLSHAILPGSVDPGVDVVGVEAEEVAPFDVGDAAFVDEAADVADWTPRRWATAVISMRSGAARGWVKGWLLACPWCPFTHPLSAPARQNATKNL